ncbi:hypothetical protein CMV_029692 [Castanea mollissima]|uniref:Germin-like protein n=1 Tax=Castanea mollissima TaxID=60419 RepID=A0A8J4V3U6_9ROSI|nr:hypothetical protein CMV_029692 [Castanea mollissima]
MVPISVLKDFTKFPSSIPVVKTELGTDTVPAFALPNAEIAIAELFASLLHPHQQLLKFQKQAWQNSQLLMVSVFHMQFYTELLFLLDGSLQVGFDDTTNKLFTQTLQAGDMFVFPKGLVHYQYNSDAKNPAIAVSAFGSANAGLVSVPNTVFTTGIDNGILAKFFKTDIATIQKIKSGANPPTTFTVTKAGLAELVNFQLLTAEVFPLRFSNTQLALPTPLTPILTLPLGSIPTLRSSCFFLMVLWKLVHYQFNRDAKNSAIAISAFGSANAGIISAPTTVFNTGIDDGI